MFKVVVKIEKTVEVSNPLPFCFYVTKAELVTWAPSKVTGDVAISVSGPKYGFRDSRLLPSNSPSNSTQEWWSYFHSTSKLKMFRFFARNFQCTWWAHCATKIYNISYTCSHRACQQSLKFSDQTDVRSLWNNSSKFRFFFQKRTTL